ncbi:hypothetical protein [Streptomyces genisteinicus]|uniref:Uncharacterized protein n=1 Tax=Streptomyces genisteinicus TaxID=2768068 RepID=A0A7H0HMV6_9ACTN|nr:hypothetical protein [Streptomyces genisteinicus]QNP61872.1 hypothetical protein IAG43_02325 [Streptomyces genisteinicus]
MTGTRRAAATACPVTAVTARALSEHDTGHTGPATGPVASVLVVVAEVAVGPAIGHIGGTTEPQL